MWEGFQAQRYIIRDHSDNLGIINWLIMPYYYIYFINYFVAGNLIRHMAIHDPDASAQEKAQALKIGRQKRLQLINGQQVRNWL